MLNAKITGIASYVPDDVLDNEELSRIVDTSDEWITTRVGIKERRVLKNGKGSSFLGTQAVQKLLAETGTNPDDVDLLICVTSNPDYRFPSTASVIMHNCGLDGASKKCYGFDIQAACAGFVVGAYTANAYIKSGLYKKVILVVAEKMTSMTDYQDLALRTEGLIGGVAANGIIMLIISLVYRYLCKGYPVHFVWIVVAGMICAVIGLIGDLTASIIKRQTGIKDYGNIMPGHGGVMDRFDSVVLVAPFMFYLYTQGLIFA